MRIGIIGCAGRMGRSNLREVLTTPGAELAGGVDGMDSTNERSTALDTMVRFSAT